MDKEYLDIDGNPITLDILCIKDPAWAASRLRKYIKDGQRIEQLEAGKKRALIIIKEMRETYKSHTPILFGYLVRLQKVLEDKDG